MFIFYSVNRQADDNKDVNPSNCLNGYPGREKKKQKPDTYNAHIRIVDAYNIYGHTYVYIGNRVSVNYDDG